MPTNEPATSYAPRLGLFSAAMAVVGGIIGAGIFLNPAIVAQRVGSPTLVLVAWILGGLVALAGAFVFAELGARNPQAGGGYVYLREAFGPLPAFLYGWTLLLVITAGGIAAVARTFASYAANLLALPEAAVTPLAAGAIVLLSVVNYVGVRQGAITQNVFTVLKLGALVLLVVVGLWVGVAGPAPTPAAVVAAPVGVWATVTAVGAALVPVLFAYGGWQSTNFIAAEIRDAQRQLPRALLLGVGIVILVYVLVNLAYLGTLGAGGLAASSAPASDVMRAGLGTVGGTLIAAGIVASTFGFLNFTILAAPRVYQAMAADGLFFQSVARLHPRYRTPAMGIVIQSSWAVIILLTGSYATLVNYVTFGDWIFFGMSGATLFVFRRRDRTSGAARPAFLAPLHPWPSILFSVASAAAVVSAVRESPLNALLAAGIIALGVPVYLAWKRGAGRAVAP
jgi:APA family basic amino acid/polyamine antiporter